MDLEQIVIRAFYSVKLLILYLLIKQIMNAYIQKPINIKYKIKHLLHPNQFENNTLMINLSEENERKPEKMAEI